MYRVEQGEAEVRDGAETAMRLADVRTGRYSGPARRRASARRAASLDRAFGLSVKSKHMSGPRGGTVGPWTFFLDGVVAYRVTGECERDHIRMNCGPTLRLRMKG